MNKFIIGGKLYDPEKGLMLCSQESPLDTVTLFKSAKGNYFTVTVDNTNKQTDAKILTKQEALAFIDDNPCGTILENYIKAFGNPKEG